MTSSFVDATMVVEEGSRVFVGDVTESPAAAAVDKKYASGDTGASQNDAECSHVWNRVPIKMSVVS